MASTYSTLPLIGIDFARRTVEQEHDLGTPTLGDNNDTWVYVQANGSVAVGTCTVGAGFQVTDAAGTYTADTAFADNEFGWVRLTASPLGFTE